MARARFPDLSTEAFQSQTDRRALEALKRVPLLPKLVQKFYEVGADRWLYCWNMATAVRCGPRQYPTLHALLQECCSILDVPEPELYVSGNPFPNAFAGGVERPYITVRSSMIDTLDDEQMLHLIGHELGHIKCGHVLYKSIAALLFPLLEMLGRRTFGLTDAVSIGMLMAFYEWSRQAEITCDRAGLLCAQELELSVAANLAMTAGPNRLSGESSTEEFLQQARAYQDMNTTDSIGKLLIFYFYSSRITHPMPVHRTQQLEKWVLSGEFDRIMRGEYAGAPASS